MKFKKRVLTSGFHVVGDKKGNRKAAFIPPSRINHWVKQHKAMRKSGLNIPAPEYHASEENPNKYLMRKGSKSNYGFWDSLEAGTDEKGNVTLEGVIDVPTEEDANKISNTVRETSVFSENKFLDGNGKVWEDVLTHIACVTKPIEPGQDNFAPVNAYDQSVSMSHEIAMDLLGTELLNDNETMNGDLVSLLRDVAGIEIPANLEVDKMQEFLMVALKQKQLTDSSVNDGGTESKPPKNSDKHEVPVVMSQQTQRNGAVPTTAPQVTTPVEQPIVETASTTEVPASDPQQVVMAQQHAGMMNHLSEERKKSARSRLNNLQRRGIVKDENTIKSYTEQIDAIQMSFTAEGKPELTPIEMTLNNLELIKGSQLENPPMVAMATQTEGGVVVEHNPIPQGGGSFDGWKDEDWNDTIDQVLSGTNF